MLDKCKEALGDAAAIEVTPRDTIPQPPGPSVTSQSTPTSGTPEDDQTGIEELRAAAEADPPLQARAENARDGVDCVPVDPITLRPVQEAEEP